MDVPKPVLVAIGGVAGAAIRWSVTELFDRALWSLMSVNSAGAFLLAFLVRGRVTRADVHLFLGVGFCGALTTFSTLAFEVAARLDDGNLSDAAGFTIVTVVVGLAGAVTGSLVAARGAGREIR